MATIIQVCLSSNCGGMEIYVERISQALAQRGHRVRVITAAGTYLAGRVPAVINHPVGVGVGDRLRLGIQIPNEITQRKPDTIHVHGGLELPYAVLAKLRSRHDVRLIYSRHINLNRPKKDPWHRFLYRYVDAYLAVSEQVREQALRRVPIDVRRVHLLHLGVDSAATEPSERAAARARLGFNGNCFLVGAFSRIEHAKGQHTLIEAVSLLRQRGIDVQAFIMGHVSEAWYRERLMRRVRELNIDARVVFLDFVPEAHVLMGACDAIALPSREEGFPLVALEAMAAGVPVLGTRNGGNLLNLIEQEESGLLFAWEDAGMLARHLEALYRDPRLRARFAHNGQDLVRRRFSTEAHMAALEAHLLGLPIPGLASRLESQPGPS
jgi:glycosyltransferase involved in cell wall biosynthesis